MCMLYHSAFTCMVFYLSISFTLFGGLFAHGEYEGKQWNQCRTQTHTRTRIPIVKLNQSYRDLEAPINVTTASNVVCMFYQRIQPSTNSLSLSLYLSFAFETLCLFRESMDWWGMNYVVFADIFMNTNAKHLQRQTNPSAYNKNTIIMITLKVDGKTNYQLETFRIFRLSFSWFWFLFHFLSFFCRNSMLQFCSRFRLNCLALNKCSILSGINRLNIFLFSYFLFLYFCEIWIMVSCK